LSPWEFLAWAVALGVSLIVVALAIAVVTVVVRQIRNGSVGQKKIKKIS